MASSKIEYLWQLLSSNNFKEDIPEDFNCIICHKVTIEPFAALCECRFCYICIKEYLKEGKKHCPGIKNDCVEEYLEIDVNVTRDMRAIRSLGRINVKCPNEMCEIRSELENMNDHLRVCGMSKTKCPYENIGCHLRQISRNNVKTHYDNEWLFHTKLIVEAIDNLRNDVEELKKVVERRDEEINKLKEDAAIKDILINEIKEQIDYQRKEIAELKVKDERRDREMEVMKENQKKTMMEELENVKRNIVEMDVREDIEDQRKSLNDLRVNQENIEREINSVVNKVKDAQIFDEREFLWRVIDFSKMKEDRRVKRVILWRYSLKLYLSFWSDGDYLGFGCRIMKGEFNDLLEWPMKHKITLSLINQATAKSHKSAEYHFDSFEGDKSAFDKPERESNDYFIGDHFINFTTIKEITDTPGLLLDDSVILSLNIDHN